MHILHILYYIYYKIILKSFDVVILYCYIYLKKIGALENRR